MGMWEGTLPLPAPHHGVREPLTLTPPPRGLAGGGEKRSVTTTTIQHVHVEKRLITTTQKVEKRLNRHPKAALGKRSMFNRCHKVAFRRSKEKNVFEDARYATATARLPLPRFSYLWTSPLPQPLSPSPFPPLPPSFIFFGFVGPRALHYFVWR